MGYEEGCEPFKSLLLPLLAACSHPTRSTIGANWAKLNPSLKKSLGTGKRASLRRLVKNRRTQGVIKEAVEVVVVGCLGNCVGRMVGEEASGTLGLVKDEVWERGAADTGRSLCQTRAKGAKEEEEEDAILPVVVTGRLLVVVVVAVAEVVAVAMDAVGWMGAAEVLFDGKVLTAWLPFGSTSRLFFFLFVS
jgi:hypothetical protein